MWSPLKTLGLRAKRTRYLSGSCPLRVEPLEGRTLLSFYPPVHYEMSGGAITSGDFNGDWMPDLVTSSALLLNNGDGTFTAGESHLTNQLVVPADLNLDGLLDLASPSVVRLGNGDGTFQPALPHGGGEGVRVADLNGDGIPDLVVWGSNGFTPRLGNGDGTFQPGQQVPISSVAFQIAAGDFNLDGYSDVVVTDTLASEARVYLSSGDGTFQEFPPARTIFPTSSATGDLNLDGYPDLVTVSYANSSVNVNLGNGDGTLQEGIRHQYNGDPRALVLADINGDGIPDVVASDNYYSNTIAVYLGNGDGTLQWRHVMDAGRNATALTADDFNGDGSPDLATNGGGSFASVFLNAGDWSGGAPGAPSAPGDGKTEQPDGAGEPLDLDWVSSFLAVIARKRE